MRPADLLIAAVVLGGAIALLYRSIRRTRGGCPGCASGGCGARREASELVRLGRRDGA